MGMHSPGDRSRLMRSGQNRVDAACNQGGRIREQQGVPGRFKRAVPASAPFPDFSAFSFRRPTGRQTRVSTPEPSRQTHTGLAIEPFLPTIMKTFRSSQVMIVQAPTGTGKSIGISEAIVKEGYRLIVTNPRRIGAVLLAQRLAERDGSRLGETFGYRHGRRKEAAVDCQAVLTTEGYHLQQMLHQTQRGHAPQLDRTAKYAVMWDEAHERTANGSIMLHLWRELMLDGYDIKLVISSATIDPNPIVGYFAQAGISVPVLNIPVRHHNIETDYGEGPIIDDILSSPRSLVFVHGKGEIERLSEKLGLVDPSLEVITLHGGLAHDELQGNIRTINQGKKGRIAVLTTNLSQASVTYDIDGVISSGLVRRERMGEDFERHLTVEESSMAEEQQKRGRAGRLRPGTYSYRGPVPYDQLPAEMPHEIENCQLESLVLKAINSGRDFSKLNSKLLYRAPPSHIDRALRSLYRLDLIGPRDHITSLGRQVAELPVEVRSGKALALAIKSSDSLRLPPDQLIIPTIDMISCIEAEGIVTWKSIRTVCGEEEANDKPCRAWLTRLLGVTHNSDPVAHMSLFQRLLRLRRDDFRDWGIDMNHFDQALMIRESIFERLNIDPSARAAADLNDRRLRQLKEFHWAGSIDRLYRFVGLDKGDPTKRLFKAVVDPGGPPRLLSRDSVVMGKGHIVAEPLTLDREYLDPEPTRLLVMSSAVDEGWLDTHTPPQLRTEVLGSMDMVRKEKRNTRDGPAFYRPGPNVRRR